MVSLMVRDLHPIARCLCSVSHSDSYLQLLLPQAVGGSMVFLGDWISATDTEKCILSSKQLVPALVLGIFEVSKGMDTLSLDFSQIRKKKLHCFAKKEKGHIL